jgi:hypothetical protein
MQTKEFKELEKIAQAELELNIEHQIKNPKEFAQIGYEFLDGLFVFMLLISLPIKLGGMRK